MLKCKSLKPNNTRSTSSPTLSRSCWTTPTTSSHPGQGGHRVISKDIDNAFWVFLPFSEDIISPTNFSIFPLFYDDCIHDFVHHRLLASLPSCSACFWVKKLPGCESLLTRYRLLGHMCNHYWQFSGSLEALDSSYSMNACLRKLPLFVQIRWNPSRQGPRFSIRMVIGIFSSDAQYLSNSTNIHKYWDGNAV